MSKSVEGNTDSRWHHLPKARSWVGSRAYIRGETSRDKANNKCVLNMIRRNKHRGTEATEQGQGESKEKQNTQGQVFRQRKGTKSTDKKKKGPKFANTSDTPAPQEGTSESQA